MDVRKRHLLLSNFIWNERKLQLYSMNKINASVENISFDNMDTSTLLCPKVRYLFSIAEHTRFSGIYLITFTCASRANSTEQSIQIRWSGFLHKVVTWFTFIKSYIASVFCAVSPSMLVVRCALCFCKYVISFLLILTFFTGLCHVSVITYWYVPAWWIKPYTSLIKIRIILSIYTVYCI